MKAVGVKALKNGLSKYLREVEAGEVVLVTDRDRVVAELRRPTTPVPGRVGRWEAFLNEQEGLGKLRRPRHTVEITRPSLPPLPGPIDLARLLEETRADRS